MLLFILKFPIAFAFGIASAIFLTQTPFGAEVIFRRVFNSLNSYPLIAVPLFILVGRILTTGGVARRLFRFALSLVGFLRGGLGHVNVLISILFAGMSGSATADAAGIGALEIPAMLEEGYDLDFSCAITAASATIGPIIPPSILMVVFGWLADVSIGKLFLGGMIPGILMGIFMMIYTHFVALKRNYPRSEKIEIREIWLSFKDSFFALLVPIIIMGGILLGVFTATEASIVAAIYSLFISLFIYRDLKLRDLPQIFLDAAIESGAVLLIIAFSSAFAWQISMLKIPELIQEYVFSFSFSPFWLLLVLNIILLIIGMFINGTAALIMITPMVVAFGKAAGIDPIQLGVLLILNLQIGSLTPPVGTILFVVSTVGKIDMLTLIRSLIPFWIILILILLIITYFPRVSLFLPTILF